jgi:hypothetical protein
MTADYYKEENYCEGFECAVVQHELGGSCCPWSNSCNNKPDDKETKCNKGGTDRQMADAANYFVGSQVFQLYGPLDQDTLDQALNSKRVIMMTVDWKGGGGHALSIGGCGNGYYYLHDPWGWSENQPSDWQGLTYGQLLHYSPDKYNKGTWCGRMLE